MLRNVTFDVSYDNVITPGARRLMLPYTTFLLGYLCAD